MRSVLVRRIVAAAKHPDGISSDEHHTQLPVISSHVGPGNSSMKSPAEAEREVHSWGFNSHVFTWTDAA